MARAVSGVTGGPLAATRVPHISRSPHQATARAWPAGGSRILATGLMRDALTQHQRIAGQGYRGRGSRRCSAFGFEGVSAARFRASVSWRCCRIFVDRFSCLLIQSSQESFQFEVDLPASEVFTHGGAGQPGLVDPPCVVLLVPVRNFQAPMLPMFATCWPAKSRRFACRRSSQARSIRF